ncbi:uncharacterized protein LOC113554556 [Rhopalosiphum maidis]|uniref:uncharacterized protein LOC113554556 n=1 Tax=Rhopalosiphum maidis TaxID=43146 RepID=UPI000EFEB9B9|nr:uncharacterized protein LOC113554556 [Rhopalosiphum maidis]
MVDFDIKSQLDLLNDYLDREMEEVKTEYFVIKSDSMGSDGNRPTFVDDDASTCIANGSHYDCSWPTYKGNRVSFPRIVSKKRSKAIDIIDPETGEKIQL